MLSGEIKRYQQTLLIKKSHVSYVIHVKTEKIRDFLGTNIESENFPIFSSFESPVLIKSKFSADQLFPGTKSLLYYLNLF